MLLSILLKNVNVISEYDDCEISTVCCDSNMVVNNCAFVCIKGENFNGNDFAKNALQNGAAIIITEEDINLPCVMVADARETFCLMCKTLYSNVSDNMTMIATTGTNGKTSVTSIISSILRKAYINVGDITTIKASFRDYEKVLQNTTPTPLVLHEILAEMRKCGCDTVCLEASSHALSQKRLSGINFDVAVFTNLTQDHLDYHHTMEEYYQAKKLLFDVSEYAVINIDDDYGKRLCSEIAIPCATYSLEDANATFFADNIVYNNNGVTFVLHHNNIESKMNFAIPGAYSVKNVLAAIAVAKQIGVSFETIILAVEEFNGIIGRSEIIKTNRNFTIICDYAHTPDGLYNIIKSTKEYAKGRIIVVFGCGGDRDKKKRALMGEISTRYADFSVITTDNPRSESPVDIINDILRGVIQKSKYIAFLCRNDAIRYAIIIAKRNDIIILAGKGHELYSQIGDVKLYYDERKIVQGILSSMEDELLE